MSASVPAPRMSIEPPRPAWLRSVPGVMLWSSQALLMCCLLLAAGTLLTRRDLGTHDRMCWNIGILVGWNGMVWATGLQAVAVAMGAPSRLIPLACATTAAALPICLIGLTARGTEATCGALAIAVGVCHLAGLAWLQRARSPRP